MQFLILLSLCVAAASAVGDERIINGDDASIYSHPYIASLQQYIRTGYYTYQWSHTCGGSLITKDWVLTAAHCVDMISSNQLSNIRVEVGAINLYEAANKYEQTIGVAEIIIHSGWDGNAAGMPNDIALIRLSSSAVVNNNVKIATLAETGASFLGSECVLAGWGQVATGENAISAMTLKEVAIMKISTSACRYYWGSGITDDHICVHDATPAEGDRPSACMGDSGGPMMCGAGHNILAGVTSWGETTCSGALPSIYTRVSAYQSWINQYVTV